MKKKINPRRRPASQADVVRAKKSAEESAIQTAWAIFFMVLRDKEGYELEDLRRVWAEIENLSDSIDKGYCTVSDLSNTLKQEIGATLK